MKQFYPTGNLYTSNPSGLKYIKEDVELWQIMRAGYDFPEALRVQELSPSDELFQTYLRAWKNKSPKEWWPLYEQRFQREMQHEEMLKGLRNIYKRLLLGKNIVLLCFCDDHRICHRRLVGEFFEPYNVKAIELNPVKTEQISFF